MPIWRRLLAHLIRLAVSRASIQAGQQNRDQQSDDPDNDEQLDEGKPLRRSAGESPTPIKTLHMKLLSELRRA